MRVYIFLTISFFMSMLMQVQAQDQQKETRKAILELRELLSIPNNGLNAKDIQNNIDYLSKAFTKRGFKTQEIKTLSNPLLFAERVVSADLPTVLFYMHLDGQPVDKSKWDQADPYTPVLKQQNEKEEWETINWTNISNEIDPDWRIFGRSASDDKMPIVAFLNSIDNLKEQQLKCNIKVVLDSEEEMGSRNLAAAVKENLDLLSADALIINDGPVHISGEPTLVFGCRGITSFHLTVYGAVKPQHSGHYGNYAPNPAFRLSQLLASMKDDDGRVIIKGYYDGIELSNKTREILAAVPDKPANIHALLQINQPELVGANYQESLQYPSLNIRGLKSAWVGAQARTIVPDLATAAIDIRLVPESDPDRLIALVRKHIEAKGYLILDREPTKEERINNPRIVTMKSRGATLPFRTDMDAPISNWLKWAIKSNLKKDPIQIRIMGGTVPMAPFIKALNVPAVIVPMVNADNNQHSPNENVRVGYITNAIRTFSAILTTPFDNR